MRLLLILYPEYSFPHRLDDFPLANTLYKWLKQDERYCLMIVANTDIFIEPSMRNQIKIKYLRPGRKVQGVRSPWLFQMYILKWLRSFQPTHILFDSLDTVVLFQSKTISSLWMKRFQKLPYYVLCRTKKSFQAVDFFLQKRKPLQLADIIYTNPFVNKHDTLPGLVKNHLFHQLPALVFAPAQEDEKANIKNQLTNGCEYFLCSAAFVNKKNLVNLLKAFSIFKKRFKNQFVLVLSGISVKNHTLISVISGYKYRNDIVVLPENLMHSSALVMASCYAHIGTADDIYPYDIIACFASGIPVIVDNTMYEPAETELFLTYTNDDVQGLAAQMMLLYKDESLRDRMIRSSRAYMDQIRQDADDPNRLNSILRKADI